MCACALVQVPCAQCPVPVALAGLSLEINRAIMEAAGGVRCAPAFLGCYNDVLGTFCYINAGHTPALLKDRDGLVSLESSGFPLGLFSHATHEGNRPAGRAHDLELRGAAPLGDLSCFPAGQRMEPRFLALGKSGQIQANCQG